MSRSIRRRTRLTFPWHRRSPPPRASSRRRRPPPPIYSPPRHPALSPSAVRCPRAPSSCGGGGGRRRRVQRESASRGARSRLLQSCVKEIGEEILTGPNLTIRVGEVCMAVRLFAGLVLNWGLRGGGLLILGLCLSIS
ncbi:hypothetical protein GUJ93_ZPchr0003g16468 [Zizania palustris]|uniref:Uncharacterized protein n=1 Tax=Zizania palustris TaxID=103762 RepID=A0A8J5SMP7_ZIZPA|nr:hypothetical protein GUJ93_ZPchr0003g16468 [Zizania palustris]